MANADWEIFRQRWEDPETGYIPCVVTGEIDGNLLSVDHIVPRSNNGTNDATNLQPLRRDLNSSKGNRPDNYWRKSFYFDQPVDQHILRVSQWDFIHQCILEYREQFGKPFSAISGKLFNFFQIVGAGKTLGMFTLPFALNRSAQLIHPATTRVDRMLILVKSQELREQISNELRTEPVKYGIVSEPPRVREVTRGTELADTFLLKNHDIFVACQHMIWDEKNQRFEDLTGLLDEFPLICFDEMHYAHTQIRRIVRTSRHSLCFGFSASPIDASMGLLDDMVRCSVFGYTEAIIHDNSMKSIGETLDPHSLINDYSDIITELRPESAEVFECGATTRIHDIESINNYDKNLAPILSVASAVVEQLYSLDTRTERFGILSPHRLLHRDHQSVVGKPYLAHAIICVDARVTAKRVADHLNKMFRRRPGKFPRKQGWWAEAVYSDGEPLHGDHPWFRYKNRGARPDAKCVCILVVVDMACEGTNNKYCSVIGFASPIRSAVKIVQRIGRALRSTQTENGNGEHVVPPADHDRVHLITHREFVDANGTRVREEDGKIRPKRTSDYIREALDFIRNMPGFTASVPSLADYFDKPEFQDIPDDDDFSSLQWTEKLNLIQDCGAKLLTGNRLSVREMQAKYGRDKRNRRRHIQRIVEILENGREKELRKLRNQLFLQPSAAPENIVLEEDLNHSMSDDDLLRWAAGTPHGKAKVQITEQFPGARDLMLIALRGDHMEHQKGFHVAADESLEKISNYIHSLMYYLRQVSGLDVVAEGTIASHLYVAAKMYLGVPAGEQLSDDSKWNVSAVLHRLRQFRVKMKLMGFTIYQLAKRGELPEIERALGISMSKAVYAA